MPSESRNLNCVTVHEFTPALEHAEGVGRSLAALPHLWRLVTMTPFRNLPLQLPLASMALVSVFTQLHGMPA